MLPKRTFRQNLEANMAYQQTTPHNDVIKQMIATAAAKQTGSPPMQDSTAPDPKRSLW